MKLINFITRRAVSAAIVIVGVVTVIFVLSRLVGDPISLMIQPGMTQADIDGLRRYWELDKPVLEQFGIFMRSALTGNFGNSIWQNVPALGLVLQALPATLLLTTSALVFALIGALILGSISALYQRSVFDRAIGAFTLIGQSVPSFWLALMLILVFANQLRLFPTGGYGSVRHLVMPTLALGLFPLARLTRLVRAGLVEALAQDYIRTARSKGLTRGVILMRHCLPNIAISLVTVVDVDFGLLMVGAVITETIFAWPLIGRLMIQAIDRRDYPVMQAGAFVIAISVVLSSLLADLTYALVNPKVRYG